MPAPSHPPSSLVISYLTLRKAIGVLGTALPFVLALGALALFGTGIRESISAYYHTGMGDVFVGVLCAIGVFLLSYRGYERKDDLAGDVAGVCAVGVALFPVAPPGAAGADERIVGAVHFAFAALFFLTLAYFSLCLFTKTDPAKTPTRHKLMRNRVYQVCGWTILAAIGLVAVHALLPANIQEALRAYDPIFWLESIAVIAFGISWLAKGEAILRDEV